MDAWLRFRDLSVSDVTRDHLNDVLDVIESVELSPEDSASLNVVVSGTKMTVQRQAMSSCLNTAFLLLVQLVFLNLHAMFIPTRWGF